MWVVLCKWKLRKGYRIPRRKGRVEREKEGKESSVRASIRGRRENDNVICASSTRKNGLDKSGRVSPMYKQACKLLRLGLKFWSSLRSEDTRIRE